MSTFVDTIHEHLYGTDPRPPVSEMHPDGERGMVRQEFAEGIGRMRSGLSDAGVAPGDRVVHVASNGIHWAMCDMAILFEGAISVPMYPRQAVHELVEMMHDCQPRLVIVDTPELWHAILEEWPEAPLTDHGHLLRSGAKVGKPAPRDADDICTIVYTSGTSGTAKGAMISIANVDHMLPVTSEALADLMNAQPGNDRVYHYLPLCFMGSRIVLWTCLWRDNNILLNLDLERIADELEHAAPHYLLNVPVLLERIRSGAEAALHRRSALVEGLYAAAKRAWARQRAGEKGSWDGFWLSTAERFIFSRIRGRFGPNLQFLICGSAPLHEDTYDWFQMIGIPVYQVYGLTETTAIVTMDTPRSAQANRVGRLIPGVEARLGEGDELLVRGPNIFPGYWNRPDATDAAFTDDWFRTGDQAEVDGEGVWRIVGRVKNLLVPSSGHNVAPEPIEADLLAAMPGAEQVVLIGHGRPHLTMLVTGDVSKGTVKAAIEAVNAELPHYKRVRDFHLRKAPFTPEEGLLTANGKLKRRAIEEGFATEIDRMYAP